MVWAGDMECYLLSTKSRLTVMSFKKFLSRWATCLENKTSQSVSQFLLTAPTLLDNGLCNIYGGDIILLGSVQSSDWQLTRASCSYSCPCSRSQLLILCLLVIKLCMHLILLLSPSHFLHSSLSPVSFSHSSTHFCPYSFILTQLKFNLSYSYPSHMDGSLFTLVFVHVLLYDLQGLHPYYYRLYRPRSFWLFIIHSISPM